MSDNKLLEYLDEHPALRDSCIVISALVLVTTAVVIAYQLMYLWRTMKIVRSNKSRHGVSLLDGGDEADQALSMQRFLYNENSMSNAMTTVYTIWVVVTLCGTTFGSVLMLLAEAIDAKVAVITTSINVLVGVTMLFLFILTRKTVNKTHNPFAVAKQFFDLDEKMAGKVTGRVDRIAVIIVIVGFVLSIVLGINEMAAQLSFTGNILIALGSAVCYCESLSGSIVVSLVPILLMHVVIATHSLRVRGVIQSVTDTQIALKNNTKNEMQQHSVIGALIADIHSLRHELESTSKACQTLIASYFLFLNGGIYVTMVQIGSGLAFNVYEIVNGSSWATLFTCMCVLSMTYIALYLWLFMRLAVVSSDLEKLQLNLSDLSIECMYVLFGFLYYKTVIRRCTTISMQSHDTVKGTSLELQCMVSMSVVILWLSYSISCA